MTEKWKTHPDYPELQFSSDGRARYAETGAPIHGRPVGKMGYHGFTYAGKTLYLHKEVATLFVPNPNGHKYVVQVNEDRWDNKAENLEWRAKRKAHEVNPDSKYGAKLTETDRAWIREHYQPGHRLFGQQGLAKKFGVSQQTINGVVNG